MALRTVITPQNLSLFAGQAITTQGADQVNGMQVKNTGIQVVLIKTGAADSINVTFASQPDAFNRKNDIGPIAVAANSLVAFGPFIPPVNFGDGAAQLFLDFTGSSGNPQVAVITII
jgi:hypothetical protein